MAKSAVDNSIYDHYGDRWYTAYDDPVALLRAENLVKTPWIVERIKKRGSLSQSVLDVGCGAGFLSNALAKEGMQVTGIDLSEESLRVAKLHDDTSSVNYLSADALRLPFPDDHFDVVTAMDFLEHVENPQLVIKEISRVLKPDGLFFFHTFNRNILAWLVVIKMVEWLVKNTPVNMHVLRLFIKPSELIAYNKASSLVTQEMTGLRPVLSSIQLKNLLTGVVPKSLRFTYTRSLLLSYLGVAQKRGPLLQ